MKWKVYKEILTVFKNHDKKEEEKLRKELPYVSVHLFPLVFQTYVLSIEQSAWFPIGSRT